MKAAPPTPSQFLLHFVRDYCTTMHLSDYEQKFEAKRDSERQSDGRYSAAELVKAGAPKATHDPKLAGKIYEAIEQELKTKARAVAFEKFCAKVELPDLEPKSVTEVQKQLSASFGDADLTIKPNRKEQTLAVEVGLKDGTQWSSEIKVRPLGAPDSEEQEIVLKFVPFPVSLPGDAELVWSWPSARA